MNQSSRNSGPERTEVLIETQNVSHLFYDVATSSSINDIVTINDEISLPSDKLDCLLDKHIIEILRETKQNMWTKEFGLIKKILSMNIIDSYISRADSTNHFIISYIAEASKPKIGKYAKGVVLLVNGTRMFIDLGDFGVVIVNGDTMGSKYVFTECLCQFPIFKGTIITDIVIDTVEYKDNKFYSIGRHLCGKQNQSVL